MALQSGDIIAAFTDGVPEVENRDGEEFGEEGIVEFIKKNSHLTAEQMTASLFREILDFSGGNKFRDDFTLVLLKVK